MRVEYKWATNGIDPEEINSVTLNVETPRVDDMIMINVDVGDGEYANKNGRVKSVHRQITNKDGKVKETVMVTIG